MVRLKRRMSIAAGTTALLMLSAGCGGSADSDRPVPEQENLKVGVPAAIAAVPVYLGVERGIFADHDLAVEIVGIEPEQAVKNLIEGEIDIVVADYPSMFRLQDDGEDIRIIDEAYQAGPGVVAVVVAQGSSIDTPDDLSGKTVAVDQIDGLGWNSLRATLAAQAMPTDITPTAMPMAQMPEALNTGAVDAAWMQEPFISAAEQGDSEQKTAGVRRVLDTATGPLADLPISGYAATGRWVTSVPQTVRAFKAAIGEAKELANVDRAAVEQALIEHAGITAQTAALVRIGQFPTAMVPNRLQRVADLVGLDNLVVEVYTRLTPAPVEEAPDG